MKKLAGALVVAALALFVVEPALLFFHPSMEEVIAVLVIDLIAAIFLWVHAFVAYSLEVQLGK